MGAHVQFSRSFSQLWVLCEINLMVIYWSPLSPFPNQLIGVRNHDHEHGVLIPN